VEIFERFRTTNDRDRANEFAKRFLKMQNWLEDFEAELRSDLEYYKKHSMECCDIHPTNAIRDYIKEILGDVG